MSAFRFAVNCKKSVGDVPALAHAVMGNMAYNLLRTGVRLQKTLEGISEQPLLRRLMCPLSTGMGIDKGTGLYRESADGSPVFDFTILDQVLACMVGPKCIPFFGIAFMPEDLSSALSLAKPAEGESDLPPEARLKAARALPPRDAGDPKSTDRQLPAPGSRNRAPAGQKRPSLPEPWMQIDRFPPRDYQRWYEVVRTTVRHLVERYGREEVSRWHFDFWNEPDLRFYWLASHEEFFRTYDFAAAAVKDVLPEAKVGGCGVADPRHAIFKEFLEHCTSGTNSATGGRGAPLDFITFHVKGGPTGRKGIFLDPWQATDYERRQPSLTHVLDTVRWGLQLIGSIEGTKGLPVFLTECDIDWGTGTSIYVNPNMHYRNSEYFPAFECALVARLLDLRAQFPGNPLQAGFLDTFFIPGFRIFEGQRTLITGDCIDKPILNGLRLLGKLGPNRLAVRDEGPSPVDVLATATSDSRPRVMAVNFNEQFAYADQHAVSIELEELSAGPWECRHYRIDHAHSNAYTVWLAMGRPVVPNDGQLAAIHPRMGLELAEPPLPLAGAEGKAVVETVLPPHSVSLWVVDRA